MSPLHSGPHTIANRARHLVAALLLFIPVGLVRAEDVPEFHLTFRDGAIIPLEIKVPANRRIRLTLVNEGDSPIEFESVELRKEKVVAPKGTTSIIIRRLAAGAHVFFDDFHPDAPQARIIAEEELK